MPTGMVAITISKTSRSASVVMRRLTIVRAKADARRAHSRM